MILQVTSEVDLVKTTFQSYMYKTRPDVYGIRTQEFEDLERETE